MYFSSLTVSISSFYIIFFCQIVKLELRTVSHSIANTKEHHCKFAYLEVLPTLWLCYNIKESNMFKC